MTPIENTAKEIALKVAKGADPRQEYAVAVRKLDLSVGECAALRTKIDAAMIALLRELAGSRA